MVNRFEIQGKDIASHVGTDSDDGDRQGQEEHSSLPCLRSPQVCNRSVCVRLSSAEDVFASEERPLRLRASSALAGNHQHPAVPHDHLPVPGHLINQEEPGIHVHPVPLRNRDTAQHIGSKQDAHFKHPCIAPVLKRPNNFP